MLHFKRTWTLKKVLAGFILVLALGLLYLALFPVGAKPDKAFDTTVQAPAYVERHPVITFDEGHNNSHSISGGYLPFAKLMENDGYTVRQNMGLFTSDVLRQTDILVIVNADGGSNPKLFGINLVPLRKGERGSPAFTAEEIRTIQEWVENGGSLLLVADHAPFGTAASELATALGVTMHGGFTEAANQYPEQEDPSSIQFSLDNGLLAKHPITKGRSASEQINKIQSFTGQSLDGPQGSELLMLPPSAIENMPLPADSANQLMTPEAENPSAGIVQAVAFDYGQGRVVVLGEAAMITAQIDQQGRRFGMNLEGLDNRQFALNIMHWLSHLL
jgi:hypothetical protein